MLVLTVPPDGLVYIGDEVWLRNNGNRPCELAFSAPRSVRIERQSVRDRRLSSTCGTCQGCGKVSDTVVPEPWAVFSAAMPRELVAVTRSKPCPDCGGPR